MNNIEMCFFGIDELPDYEMEQFTEEALFAQDVLLNKRGPGAEFTGWVDLPVNYDKEEFARIKKAAEKIATGQITFAARDSEADGHSIKKGQIMAMNAGKIAFVDEDLNKYIKTKNKRIIIADFADKNWQNELEQKLLKALKDNANTES